MSELLKEYVRELKQSGDKDAESIAAELTRLQAIEAAASDAAKQWFTNKREMGWAMDNLVSALERK